MLDFLLEEKNQYTKDDRVLIYVMSIALAERLSEYLRCQVLHRNVQDKESVLTRFRSHNSSVLVCTSVLSAGFDYSSVRAVIHFQSAYSIIDFAQESGRAGRDNQPAKSVVFISSASFLFTERDSEAQKAFKLTYLAEKVCRRRVLNAELDDQHMTECVKNQHALCDLCRAREVERDTVRENVLTSQQAVEIEKSNFFQVLDYFTDVCTFCFVMSLDFEVYKDHHFKNCKAQKHIVSAYLSALEDIRARRLLITDSCCFICFLPTAMCYQTRNSNHSRCKYNNIVFSIVFAAFYLQPSLNVHEILSDFDTTNCNRLKTYISLMLKKTRAYDTDAIVAILFFRHVLEFCTRERLRLQDT